MPIPMSSRSVRPAGNQHSCGDTSVAVLIRHTKYPPGTRVVAGSVCRPNIELRVSQLGLRGVVILVDYSSNDGSSADGPQVGRVPDGAASRCPGAAAVGTGAVCARCNGPGTRGPPGPGDAH